MLFDVACAMQEFFRRTACPAAVLYGEEHVAVHTEQLQVIWVPVMGDEFGPPTFTGGPTHFGAAMYEGLNPRTFACRWASADLHIWGFAPVQKDQPERQVEKDYAVLDALVNHTLLALHKLCSAPGYRARRAGNLRSVLNVRRGFTYILPIQVQIPLVDVSAFPCDKLGINAKTWSEEPIDAVAVTVEERVSIPTGTLIDSVSFTVSEE